MVPWGEQEAGSKTLWEHLQCDHAPVISPMEGQDLTGGVT